MPLARPALAAGAALAAMEALADFGAVNLLGYRTLTDAIYRVWYGAFDEAAALQLATVLVSLALTVFAGPLFELSARASENLTDPSTYISAVFPDGVPRCRRRRRPTRPPP